MQQAFRGNFSLQLAYVANHGVDISGAQNINLPSTYGGGHASTPENHPSSGGPRQQISSFWRFFSNYNSLQVQLTKRYSQGSDIHVRFHVGQGACNFISGDDGGAFVLHQPAKKLRAARFRSQVQLRAELHVRAAVRPRSPLPQLRRGGRGRSEAGRSPGSSRSSRDCRLPSRQTGEL